MQRYLETALHVSGSTTHHQERMQLYLQHLVYVTPLLLPAARGGRADGRTDMTERSQFNVHESVHRKNIPIYIQQDATLHSFITSGNCSTCFGW